MIPYYKYIQDYPFRQEKYLTLLHNILYCTQSWRYFTCESRQLFPKFSLTNPNPAHSAPDHIPVHKYDHIPIPRPNSKPGSNRGFTMKETILSILFIIICILALLLLWYLGSGIVDACKVLSYRRVRRTEKIPTHQEHLYPQVYLFHCWGSSYMIILLDVDIYSNGIFFGFGPLFIKNSTLYYNSNLQFDFKLDYISISSNKKDKFLPVARRINVIKIRDKRHLKELLAEVLL